LRAAANSARTRRDPSPAYISTKSEPDALKKGTFASPATARASRVFPVPGGPWRMIPRGRAAPTRLKRSGSRRTSAISETSFRISSMPATSAKVVSDSTGRTCCLKREPLTARSARADTATRPSMRQRPDSPSERRLTIFIQSSRNPIAPQARVAKSTSIASVLRLERMMKGSVVATRISSPPIVGVPCFALCPCGPSAPIC